MCVCVCVCEFNPEKKWKYIFYTVQIATISSSHT